MGGRKQYVSGAYWARRQDMIYYRYVDYVVRTVAAGASSLIDVGSGGCPYLEWFDWIPERVSLDLQAPYRSDAVRGLKGDLLSHDFDGRFDVCTCLQVLEHVPEPEPFARRLLAIGRTVIVTVPHRWPPGTTKGHLHDPVTLDKLTEWMGRDPNYHAVVREPFSGANGERLLALYHEDPERRFGTADAKARRIRKAAV